MVILNSPILITIYQTICSAYSNVLRLNVYWTFIFIQLQLILDYKQISS